MRIRRGPRPLSIQVFAGAFVTAAVIAFVDGLLTIPGMQAMLRPLVPEIDWTEDAVIVLLNVRLSIALIPVALIWLFGSNIARWITIVLGLGNVINLPSVVELLTRAEPVDPAWLASFLLSIFGALLLLLPQSGRWCETSKGVDRAVFD